MTLQDNGNPAARGASRIGAIDGFRTFAILSIVAYHLGLPWLPSGHMGVVMFLVLTGYLVCGSLVRRFERCSSGGEGRQAQRIAASLRSFWWRRFKRIWPAMALMVAGVAALCIVFDHVLLTKLRPDALPALAFFANWHYILEGASYFDQIGAPSPLTHLWYVGVDAQLCLALPLVLLVCMRLFHLRRAGTRRVLLVLAAVSAGLMAYLYDPSVDPSRVYYGCDTRAFSVLLGGWLALAWPMGGAPAWALSSAHDDGRLKLGISVLLELLGLAALAGLVAVMVLVPSDSPLFYRGGMVVVSLLSMLVVVAITAPRGLLGRLFALPPLTWFGERSYGVYLWHYPLIILLGAYLPTASWQVMAIAVALSVVAAAVSWKFLEEPLANGRTAAAWRFLLNKDAQPEAGRPFTLPRVVVPALAFTALAIFAIGGCIVVPEKTLVPKDAIKSTGTSVEHGMDLSQFERPVADVQAGGGRAPVDANGMLVLTETAVEEPVPETPAIPDGPLVVHASPDTVASGRFDPVLVGDSVPGDTPFYSVFPDGLLDSYIGRRPDAAISVLRDYVNQGITASTIIVAAFSNTTAWPEQLDELVAVAGPDRQVFLVATVNTDGFMEEANRYLMECADRYENVHYVDWPAAAAGHEDFYIYPDGTHVTPDGAWVYLETISREVAPVIVGSGGWADPL